MRLTCLVGCDLVVVDLRNRGRLGLEFGLGARRLGDADLGGRNVLDLGGRDVLDLSGRHVLDLRDLGTVSRIHLERKTLQTSVGASASDGCWLGLCLSHVDCRGRVILRRSRLCDFDPISTPGLIDCIFSHSPVFVKLL
jgi:hypothetical protein